MSIFGLRIFNLLIIFANVNFSLQSPTKNLDTLDGRFFGFPKIFLKPSVTFETKQPTEDPFKDFLVNNKLRSIPRPISGNFGGWGLRVGQAACEARGGTLVRHECYEYFSDQMEFDDARSVCQGNGGDLWTPPFGDPSFYVDLFTFMPEVAGADGEDVYIGVTTDGDGRALTVQGDDVTDEFLIQLNDREMEGLEPDMCLVFEFKGAFFTQEKDCSDDTQEFLCEYPLDDVKVNTNDIVINKNIFKWG